MPCPGHGLAWKLKLWQESRPAAQENPKRLWGKLISATCHFTVDTEVQPLAVHFLEFDLHHFVFNRQ
jgi:hypothetical protein